MLKPASGGT